MASLDEVVIQDYMLTEPRGTLGLRSTNDIVLADMAVSGEHMAFTYEKKTGLVVVEDLGNTNGTKVNGLKVLQSGNLLCTCKYRIRFLMNSLVAGNHYTHACETASLTAKPVYAGFPPDGAPPYPPAPEMPVKTPFVTPWAALVSPWRR